MAFTEIAFAYLAPLLILAGWFMPEPWRKWAKALLAAVSLSLILNSIFLVRQLIAMAKWAEEMARAAGISLKDLPPFEPDLLFGRMMGIIILPWFFLIRPLRNTPWLPLLMWALVCWGGLSSWNTSWLLIKSLWELSLLCAIYAALWLLKECPFQRSLLKKQ